MLSYHNYLKLEIINNKRFILWHIFVFITLSDEKNKFKIFSESINIIIIYLHYLNKILIFETIWSILYQAPAISWLFTNENFSQFLLFCLNTSIASFIYFYNFIDFRYGTSASLVASWIKSRCPRYVHAQFRTFRRFCSLWRAWIWWRCIHYIYFYFINLFSVASRDGSKTNPRSVFALSLSGHKLWRKRFIKRWNTFLSHLEPRDWWGMWNYRSIECTWQLIG